MNLKHDGSNVSATAVDTIKLRVELAAWDLYAGIAHQYAQQSAFRFLRGSRACTWHGNESENQEKKEEMG